MGCEKITTALSPKEARLIIEPYFVEAQRLFVAEGLTRVKATLLVCDSSMHDSPRHFAGTSRDGRQIVLAPELAEIDEQLVVGIIAHELGHAADFLYPGEFVVGEGESVVRRRQDDVSETQWLRWQRAWDKRDDDVVEKTADLIAGLVWGKPIGYVGPCMLESFQGGVPRPEGLR